MSVLSTEMMILHMTLYAVEIAHENESQINHHVSSSAAMESTGAVSIFLWSINQGLRYTTFVSDGDSSCYGISIRDV